MKCENMKKIRKLICPKLICPECDKREVIETKDKNGTICLYCGFFKQYMM